MRMPSWISSSGGVFRRCWLCQQGPNLVEKLASDEDVGLVRPRIRHVKRLALLRLEPFLIGKFDVHGSSLGAGRRRYSLLIIPFDA
jgi:hypothetical protein